VAQNRNETSTLPATFADLVMLTFVDELMLRTLPARLASARSCAVKGSVLVRTTIKIRFFMRIAPGANAPKPNMGVEGQRGITVFVRDFPEFWRALT